jgi:hypothetical protein
MEPTDLQKLDPMTRCFALVGRFLHAWALMEASLHGAIGEALSFDDPRKIQILCANMTFHSKLNVLSTLINVSPNISEEDKGQLAKMLDKLDGFSWRRNMIAHNAFGPDSSQKAVAFQVVKAKGKLDLPAEVWNETRFDDEIKTVEQYRGVLVNIGDRFHAQPLPPQSYTAALRRFLPYNEAEWTGRPMGVPSVLQQAPPQGPEKPAGE